MKDKRVHSHYDNLKVTRNAPPELIKAAYKLLAQKYHPDKWNGKEDANRVMQLINESYSILSDPQLRAEHDAWIAKKEAAFSAQESTHATHPPSQPRQAPPPPPPPPSENSGVPRYTQHDPSTLTAKRQIDWFFWITLLASGLLARAVGALGACVWFLIFYLCAKRIGKPASFILATAASIALSTSASQFFKNSNQASATYMQPAANSSNTIIAEREAIPPAATYIPQPSEQEVAQKQADEHFQKIFAAHPDAREILKTFEFSSWVDESPKEKQLKINKVLQSGTSAEIINLFSEYKKYRSAAAEKEIRRRKSAHYRLSDVPTNVPYALIPQVEEVARRAVIEYPFLDTPQGSETLDYIMLDRNKRISQGTSAPEALRDAVNFYAPFYLGHSRVQ